MLKKTKRDRRILLVLLTLAGGAEAEVWAHNPQFILLLFILTFVLLSKNPSTLCEASEDWILDKMFSKYVPQPSVSTPFFD